MDGITSREILENTLDIIGSLPVLIPENGKLAGFSPIALDASPLLSQYDNLHYPMGDAFYRLGVTGISEKARNRLPSTAPGRERELLDGIAQT